MKKTNLNNSATAYNNVKHIGVVTKVSIDSVTVTLKGNTNCTACHAKSSCGVSDDETKTVEVFKNHFNYSLNENVDVIMGDEMGLKAVFYAYILPFIILFTTLIISLNYIKEWQAGLLSLLVLVPYYSILYFLNSVLRKEFTISLLKLH